MPERREAMTRRLRPIIERRRDLLYRRPWLLRLLVGIGLFTLYYATAPGNRTEADDGFWYACLVRQGGFRAQVVGASSHLLFLPLMSATYRMARDTGFTISSYDLLRLVSSIGAACTGVLFYLFLRQRMNVTFHAALASAVGLCVSYGFWRYANEAEVYAPAAALTVLGLWLAFDAHSRLRLAGAVLAFAIATFISILSLIPGLFVVPAVVAHGSGLRRAGGYVAALSVLVTTIALAVYERVDDGTSSFVEFVKGPPPSTDLINGAVQSVVGFGQSLLAGNFLLTHTVVLDAFQRRFPATVFQEERFLAAHSSPWLGMIPFATLALILVSFVIVLFLWARYPQESSDRFRLLVLFLFWIIAYWLIALRVNPYAPETWTLLLIPIWIILATLIFDRVARLRPGIVWLFIGALFLHNLIGGMLLMHDTSTDFNARKAAWLIANAGPNDVILTADGSAFSRYLAYRSDARVVSLYGAYSAADVERFYRLALTTPGHVYITGDVFHPPSYIRTANPTLDAGLGLLSRNVREKVVPVTHDSLGGVYVVTDTGGVLKSGAVQRTVPACPET
jgi:hypothetical protein